MKALIPFFMILALLSSLLFNCVNTADCADKTLDVSNLTILGMVIGECSSRDISSKLGPSIPFQDEANPDIKQVCYVSDKDDTLILFSSEYFQCSRFRLMSQKKKFYKWHFCEKSPLVSKHLATASGIKLGMSKGRLKSILGTPRSESDKNMSYVYAWKRKMSPGEIESVMPYSKNVNKNPFWTIKSAIRAEFSEAGLISLEVSKHCQ